MGVAKIVLDGVTQIDLTNDTISAENLAYDKVAFAPNGELISGRAQGDNEDNIIMNTVNGTYYNPTITKVGRGAFKDCLTLYKVILPNVTTLDYQAFMGCTNLQEIECPKVSSLTNEGTSDTAYSNNNNSQTFYNCSSLKSIDLPNYTSNYNSQVVFSGCSALESVNVRNLTRQNSLSFVNCTSLKRLALPKLSHSTQAYAQLTTSMFEGCSSLEAVDAGKANNINAKAFSGCSKFNILILRKTVIQTLANTNAFTGTPFASGGEGGVIYIPLSLYNALGTGTNDYTTATNWSTINGYGTITWQPIEGSIYATKSVDGLDI